MDWKVTMDEETKKVVLPDKCDDCGGKLTKYPQYLTGNNIYNRHSHALDGAWAKIMVLAVCWECVMKEFRESFKKEIVQRGLVYGPDHSDPIRTERTVLAYKGTPPKNPPQQQVLERMWALRTGGYADLCISPSDSSLEYTVMKRYRKRFLRKPVCTGVDGIIRVVPMQKQ